MTIRLHIGECRAVLPALPDDSVHCIVTSPPYWGLRDYGVDGQIGLELTLEEHIANIVEVFEELRRVLRADGTCWMNYGDAYAAAPAGNKDIPHGDRYRPKRDDRAFVQKPFSTIGEGFKAKDLLMLPNRIAIALQEAGWWVRSEIIWAKPNPMPESVKDRPASAHEKIFLLTKSARYWYDAEAVKEPASWNAGDTKFPDGWDTGPGGHGKVHRQGREKGKAIKGRSTHGRHTLGESLPAAERRAGKGNANGFRGGSYVGGAPRKRTETGNSPNQTGLRNCRNVWTMATRPFKDAHFATFPPELAERCIKAGCPEGGIVLDPFGGAGTTGLAADRLQRDAILIELNRDFAALAARRLRADAGLMSDVTLIDTPTDKTGLHAMPDPDTSNHEDHCEDVC